MSAGEDRPRRRVEFEDQYGPVRTRGSRLVERRAFGHDLGLNSYATLEDAHALVDLLRPQGPRTILDLGSGRGWPGVLVGERLGSRIVASDVPRKALRDARTTMRHSGVSADAIVADGRWLPFASAAFDGIVHADVFC